MADLFPAVPPQQKPITLEELIAEAEREVKMRVSVYARRVENRQMTQAQADRKTECMRMIVRRLQAERERESDDPRLSGLRP